MTDKQKQAIRDMRGQEFSYRTIADALGLTYNTVKSFCYRKNIGCSSQPAISGDSRELCKYCGKPLTHLVGSKPKTFCNDKCRYSWWNKNRKYTTKTLFGEGLP